MTRLSRQEKKEETRRKLIESARVEFSKTGYYGCSVDTIAENAGYSKGAFYAHFKDKEDIFLELLEEHMRQETGNIRTLLGNTNNVEAIVSGLEVQFQGGKEEVEWKFLCIELALHAHRNAEFGEKYRALQKQHQEELGLLIQRFFQGSKCDLPEEPRILAAAFIALFHGLKLTHIPDTKENKDDPAKIVSLFIKSLLG